MNSGFDRSREPGVELFDWIGIEIATAQAMRSMFITRRGRIMWRLQHVPDNIREIEIVDLFD